MESDSFYDDLELFSLKFGEENSHSIEDRKEINNILRQAEKRAKSNKCYYCGKETNSFCNSHTIPKGFLKNISDDGKLKFINSIIKNRTLNLDKGLNKSGVFRLLCRECENKLFNDYENIENYYKIPTTKMLAQIDMKNNLQVINKKLVEIEIFKIAIEKIGVASLVEQNIDGFLYTDLEEKIKICKEDLENYERMFQYSKKILKSEDKNGYKIGYYKKLNYKVPLAFQSNIVLLFDLNKKLLNNVYKDINKLKYLNICIFPLKKESIILMFVEKNNNRYNDFFRQFEKLNLEEQLKIINWIIFAYSEDFFFSPTINETIIKELDKVTKKTTDIMYSSDISNKYLLKKLEEQYFYNEKDEIPNFMIEEYALK